MMWSYDFFDRYADWLMHRFLEGHSEKRFCPAKESISYHLNAESEKTWRKTDRSAIRRWRNRNA